MWFLSGAVAESFFCTDGGLRIYGCDGKGERQQRILGDREAEGTVTDAISSPPPSKGETLVIMWIKWQKTGHARSPPATATARGGGARDTSLSFSQLLNLDE